jgi:hypothetical protein
VRVRVWFMARVMDRARVWVRIKPIAEIRARVTSRAKIRDGIRVLLLRVRIMFSLGYD